MNTNSFGDRPDDFLDENYRPINILAIVAFVVSLVSLFAVFNLMLLAVCIFGVMLAATALYIGRSHGASRGMAGNFFAHAALMMSIFAATTSVSAKLSKQRHLSNQATAHSRVFLDQLFARDFASMMEYSKDPKERLAKSVDREKHYERMTPEPGERIPPGFEIMALKDLQPIKSMLSDDLKGELEFVRIGEIDSDIYSDYVGVDYRYMPVSADVPELEFRIHMARRRYTEPLNVQWQPKQFDVLKGPKNVDKLEMFEFGKSGKVPKKIQTRIPGQKSQGGNPKSGDNKK